MLPLVLAPAVAEANEESTSLALLDRALELDGGARRDRAASTGGEAATSVGVSQNMYIYPASSCSETGFASSASSREATSGLAVGGIKDMNCAVWDVAEVVDECRERRGPLADVPVTLERGGREV